MNKKSRTRAKRATRIRLTIVYTLMILCVGLLVTGLYLIIQGYRYNRFEGQLEQGGLVQFESNPSGASVWLDGVQLGVKTSGKLTLTSGSHTIAMKKDGYYDWNKQVTVQPGGVLWLHYIRLVPKQLVITTPLSFTGAASSIASYDWKKIALIEDATKPAVQVVNVDSSTPQKLTVAIPATSYTAPASGESQVFELVSWAHDNRYFMIKHTYGSNTEWISVDSGSQGVAKNITTTLGVGASTVAYSMDDANKVYLLDGNADVRQANLDQKTLSGPLVQNVESFDVYDSSTITYVTKPSGDPVKRTVAYLTLGAQSSRTVAQLVGDASSPARFAIGEYDGNNYLAVSQGQAVTVYQGDLSASDAKNPAAFTKYKSFSLNSDVTFLGFSPDGQRFIYAQNANDITTLDTDSGQIASRVFATSQTRRAYWLDAYHFMANENGGLQLYDFDGTNAHTLLSTSVNNIALSAQSGRYIYALQPAADGSVQLARITMIIN